MKENLNSITAFLEQEVGLFTGVNKIEELKRLLYELCLIHDWSLDDIKTNPDIKKFFKKNLQGNKKFLELKKILLELRYPVASKSEPHFSAYLPPLHLPEKSLNPLLNKDFIPEKIFIQNSIKNLALTRSVLKKFPQVPQIYFNKLKDIPKDKTKFLTDMGKRDIYLIDESFDIIKPCPCTKNAVSCNYFILNLGFGCPFDCSYCYLQHYMNIAGILLPMNLESFFKQASSILDQNKFNFVRIGTGEFFDSLALDSIVNYSSHLIEFFRTKKMLFEFKTKSNNITNLLKIKEVPKNIVISWSLNPQKIIDTEERYTASLKERLEAAQTLIAKGYKVGFHFDPIIYYAEWKKDYEEVVNLLFEYTKGKISWISVGSLRFYRKLKSIVEYRFPEDVYFYGEFILDPQDNKMRYPNLIRKHIYTNMLAFIKKRSSKIPVYLCMESTEMYKEIYGTMKTTQEIEKEFK